MEVGVGNDIEVGVGGSETDVGVGGNEVESSGTKVTKQAWVSNRLCVIPSAIWHGNSGFSGSSTKLCSSFQPSLASAVKVRLISTNMVLEYNCWQSASPPLLLQKTPPLSLTCPLPTTLMDTSSSAVSSPQAARVSKDRNVIDRVIIMIRTCSPPEMNLDAEYSKIFADIPPTLKLPARAPLFCACWRCSPPGCIPPVSRTWYRKPCPCSYGSASR